MDLSGHAHVAFEDITWLVGQGALAMIERAWSLHGIQLRPNSSRQRLKPFLSTTPTPCRAIAALSRADCGA
jgi:hypothetical protein